MKKIFLLAGLLIAFSGAFAQTITYGIKGGLNLTQVPVQSTTFGVSSSSDKYLAGFHIGGLVDIGFESFSIQPGIFYTTKGGNTDANIDIDFGGQQFTGTAKVKTKLNYLEVPVNFIYKVPAGDGKVFFGAGPYIGYGLSGNASVTSNVNGQTATQNQDVKFGNGDGEIKNPDFGFNILAGYELPMGVTLNAGYGQSFAGSSNTSGKVKNQGFQFSVGYFFR
ncbi:MAG: PorT family protein [Bacteroidota bacterium]|nr:PorT family protein [Bacteroidota bacterium]